MRHTFRNDWLTQVGLWKSSVHFDSADAMERNGEKLDGLRRSGTQDAGAEILDDCAFELAIAHLRVPEMV